MFVEQGPQNLKFGGGVSDSVLNPGVLAVVVVVGILLWIWPRNKAVAAFLAAGLLIPMDQVLVLGGMHFPMIRVLVIFGFVRILKDKLSSKAPLFSGGWNKLDLVVVLLTVVTALNGILLFREFGAVVNQLGNLYTVFGIYFLLRFLIRDQDDVIRAFRTLAYIACAVAVIMSFEFFTGHNPYAMLGGAQAWIYSALAARGDRFRAQAAFGHSILAGTFGAVLVPLFVALWWKDRKSRKLAVFAIVACTIITVACNSSTPILAYAGGVFALFLWPIRRSMRFVRRGLVLLVIALHIVMKGPVWSLIEKIDLTGGSSSWHRYQLIDQCIRHFGDWWLLGVKDTSVWGWDMWDTANQYVAICDNSGLLPFILFISVLVYGFKFLGRARRVAERPTEKDRRSAFFLWAMGAALFANVIAYIGISYWDQNMVSWYCLLATISAVTVVRPKKEASLIPVAVAGPDEDLMVQLAGAGELAKHGADVRADLPADVQRSRGLNTLYERIP
ncbi:MAG TPA: hypothetical protein VKR59_23125 [Terriglobales bacterium]|nr:hypothetical protein [Terriglobales bacterium]